MKKTPLAYEIRRDRGPGAAISVGEAARASFRARCEGELQEHYGFAIGESTIQRITFAHAEAMYEAGREELEFPEAPGLRKPIIVETDGGRRWCTT